MECAANSCLFMQSIDHYFAQDNPWIAQIHTLCIKPGQSMECAANPYFAILAACENTPINDNNSLFLQAFLPFHASTRACSCTNFEWGTMASVSSSRFKNLKRWMTLRLTLLLLGILSLLLSSICYLVAALDCPFCTLQCYQLITILVAWRKHHGTEEKLYIQIRWRPLDYFNPCTL